eukprot:scaffold102165_cov51-Phaeocystis_antarctica.AAC.1
MLFPHLTRARPHGPPQARGEILVAASFRTLVPLQGLTPSLHHHRSASCSRHINPGPATPAA